MLLVGGCAFVPARPVSAAKPVPPAKSSMAAMSKADALFKQENIKSPLPKREGAANRVWDEFVRMAPQYEDRDIMKALFAARSTAVGAGQTLAQYRFDLFSVFRANPGFFVQVANEHYKGNLDCAVDVLVPQSEVLPFYEVEDAATRRGKKGDVLLAQFMKRAREYHATMAVSGDSTLRIEKCW